jgi:hypothetical protein
MKKMFIEIEKGDLDFKEMDRWQNGDWRKYRKKYNI